MVLRYGTYEIELYLLDKTDSVWDLEIDGVLITARLFVAERVGWWCGGRGGGGGENWGKGGRNF